MKYVNAFTPCTQARSSEWNIHTAPDGEQFGLYGNHNLYMPFHPMWTDNNTYNTNCLNAVELEYYTKQNRKAGWPDPIISEMYDAYQMDFWSAGTAFRGAEALS